MRNLLAIVFKLVPSSRVPACAARTSKHYNCTGLEYARYANIHIHPHSFRYYPRAMAAVIATRLASDQGWVAGDDYDVQQLEVHDDSPPPPVARYMPHFMCTMPHFMCTMLHFMVTLWPTPRTHHCSIRACTRAHMHAPVCAWSGICVIP
jgi:hypothetical protein